ncbi:MAG: HlyD family secretion protein [Chlorobiaceae bacterium]|nr:HlyD family secretion protein [Chlorobiaceae bacterium]NTV61364.1 HlyD family secretion protein [Chlorobiaceae bacterium]
MPEQQEQSGAKEAVNGTAAKSFPGKPLSSANPVRIAIFAVLLLGGLFWGGKALYHSYLYVETDNAQIEGDIYPVISRIPGKVETVLAKDNQNIRKGDTLITLDPSDYQVRKEMAASALLGAQAAESAAAAQISEAAAAERKMSADLRRNRNLRQQDVISQAEFDAVRAGAETSSARYAASGSQHKAASAQVKMREAELRNAELQLSYTTITAPAGGHVSKKNVQPGQYVAPGQQLIALVASSDLWVVANFKETQLEKVRPGQPVIIRVDAYPGKEFRGKVESLSSGTGAKFSLLPPDNASGNFVKVTQRIPVKIVFTEKPSEPLAAGMNVIAEIKVK